MTPSPAEIPRPEKALGGKDICQCQAPANANERRFVETPLRYFRNVPLISACLLTSS